MSLRFTEQEFTLVRGPYRGGDWQLSGLDTGKLELIQQLRDTVVFKQHGHHYFGGQGQPQRYAPATFAVFRVIDGSLDDGRARVTLLVDFLARPIRGADDPYKP